MGTVPWFEHQEASDAEPRAAMSESCAASLYLATLGGGSPLNVPPGEAEHGAFLNWIAHADATLTFPQSVVMRYGLFERGRADAAADDYARWYVARLRLLTAALEDGRDFLCAGRFTAADVCVGYALYNASEHGLCGAGLVARGVEPLSARHKPAVRRYLERLMRRPAWLAAQAAG